MGIALLQASAPHSVRRTAGPLAILPQCSALMASSRSPNNSLWSTPVAPFNRMGSQGSGTFCKLTEIFYFVTGIQMPFMMFASPPWIRESFRGHGFELPFLSPWRPLADLQRRGGSLISLGSLSLCIIEHLCVQCAEEEVWFGGNFVSHFCNFSCITLIKLFNLS